MTSASDPIATVRKRLVSHGLADTIVAFGVSTHTALDAATAVGCEVDQIAKSIVFAIGDQPIIIVAAGSKRINKQLVASTIGATLRSVGPDYLRDRLGLEPGGITPLAVNPETPCLLDKTLQRFSTIWVSAGTPSQVLSITPDDLATLTGGQWIAVSDDEPSS